MANRTILAIAQDFCRRQGIKVPTVVTTSTDETVLQIWGLLNEEVTELAERAEWGWLRTRSSFNHANGANYLALDLNGVADYKGLVPDTLWASDIRLPVAGPLTEAQWTQLLLLQMSAAVYNYRVYAGGLYIYPVPAVPASVSFVYEYNSIYPVIAQDGVTLRPAFTADTDSPRLPDRIVLAGLRWRWKKEKNQAYAEEMRAYEVMVANELGRENAPRSLRLDNPDPDSRIVEPGLLIAAGNWNV